MNIELYNRIYEINLVDFKKMFEAFLTEDTELISKTVLEYLEDYLEHPDYHFLELFEEVVRVIGAPLRKENSFEFEGEMYYLVGFDNMSTGEFVDLQSYIPENDYVKIATILYRPKDDIENYQGTSKYENRFERVPYYLVMGGIKAFFDWNKQMPEIHPYLYSSDKPEEEDSLIISDADSFAEEFNWYSMLYTAAKEGYLQINGYKDVISSPAQEFLAFMNFYKRKGEVEVAMIKQKG